MQLYLLPAHRATWMILPNKHMADDGTREPVRGQLSRAAIFPGDCLLARSSKALIDHRRQTARAMAATVAMTQFAVRP